MPQINKKYKLLSMLPFLDNREKRDIKIFDIYKKFQSINGIKKHPETIRRIIETIGYMIETYEGKLLLSVAKTDTGHNVEVIIGTDITGKGKA